MVQESKPPHDENHNLCQGYDHIVESSSVHQCQSHAKPSEEPPPHRPIHQLWQKVQPQPQDDRLATQAPRLKKEEGAIDWRQAAVDIERQVRAFYPWPGTFTFGPRGQFKVLHVEPAGNVTPPTGSKPGTVFEQNRRVFVATGQGAARLVTVQPAGKKEMPAEAMVNGQPELLGAILGPEDSGQV